MSKRAGSTVVEERGNHAIHVSQPGAVAALIAAAAKGVQHIRLLAVHNPRRIAAAVPSGISRSWFQNGF